MRLMQNGKSVNEMIDLRWVIREEIYVRDKKTFVRERIILQFRERGEDPNGVPVGG